MTAPEITIERLSLRVSGIDAEQAQRLARLVAARLAPAVALGPAEGSLEHLHVALEARAGEREEVLAGRIVERLAPLIGGAGAEGPR